MCVWGGGVTDGVGDDNDWGEVGRESVPWGDEDCSVTVPSSALACSLSSEVLL